MVEEYPFSVNGQDGSSYCSTAPPSPPPSPAVFVNTGRTTEICCRTIPTNALAARSAFTELCTPSNSFGLKRILRTLMSGQMATRRRIVSIAGSLRKRRRGNNMEPLLELAVIAADGAGGAALGGVGLGASGCIGSHGCAMTF
eukprot:scaffold2445_cov156-Skeletonema_marinoi.AAC.4